MSNLSREVKYLRCYIFSKVRSMKCEVCKNVNHKYLSYEMTNDLYTYQDCIVCKERVYICCECNALLNSSPRILLQICEFCKENENEF